jgi:hypothetical protein
MSHFTAEIPSQCIKDLIALARLGDLSGKEFELADHVWYAGGCLTALLAEMNDPTIIGSTQPKPVVSEDKKALLVECLNTLEKSKVSSTKALSATGGPKGGIIDNLIAMLLPMLIEKIKELLENWLKPKTA